MDRSAVLDNLRSYSKLAELRKSRFFAESGGEVESIFRKPEVHVSPGAQPLLCSFTRVVQWNIEKGKRFESILTCLREDETLRWADLILLNEADCGMNRSANRHVARCLAERLGMTVVFAPAHYELTKGTGDDLTVEGANHESLQGNAILTRHPVLDVLSVPLPVCFEPYEFHEKRYGWRNCALAKLDIGGRALWVGSVHLEVWCTPGARARQIAKLAEHLSTNPMDPCLIGGDLNSSGFSRGTRRRTFASIGRLLAVSPPTLKEKLRHPEHGPEGLFNILKTHGFSWEGINSDQVTACSPLDGLEEAGAIPKFVVSRLLKRLEPYEGCLEMKLDWLFGRGVRGVRPMEKRDQPSGVDSVEPGCIHSHSRGPGRISDHRPIYADFVLS